jgi:UTP--glucose-1-phosphate uridylyltransferase
MANVKGIILAAGYGTRFLPITKTIPKEMLPLGTRPAIDYVVQEFLAGGIRDILIITSRRKKVMDDYFDREPDLEAVLERDGKRDCVAKIAPPNANISFVRQQSMGGTGAAVLLARTFAGDDPCVLAFPDDLHFGETPLARQLVQVWQQTNRSVLALEERPEGEDISRYGVAAVKPGSQPIAVTGLVEKPKTGTEPSRYISIGRYLLTPEIFGALEEERKGHPGGEFFLTSALHRLAGDGRLSGCAYTGTRLDTGEPLGYYEALVRHILADPEQGLGFREMLRALLG